MGEDRRMMYNIPKEDLRPLTALLDRGFLTGSRVLGGIRDSSDWDIVVSIIYRQEAESIVKPYAYSEEPSNYFQGTKYSIWVGGQKEIINLIFVHPMEFQAWYYATEALQNVLKHAEITEKAERVMIFQTLVTQFRYALPHPLAKIRDEKNLRIAFEANTTWGLSFREKFNDINTINLQKENISTSVQDMPF